MKVALVHDWLNGMRGGEKVLEGLIALYPDCEIFTLFHEKGKLSELIESRPIHQTFISKLPGVYSKYRHYLPLFPTAIESFDLNGFDLIISTSHCVAKGIIPPPDAAHISYLHTPMRYVWDMYPEYFGPDKRGPISRALIALFANYLRIWDVTSAARVDSFISNSRYVASRIEKYYRRTAEVINPPVEVDSFSISGPEDYYLVVSAFAPYKKVELAIGACRRLDRKLIVIGSGQDEAKLKEMAGPGVEFPGWLPAEKIIEYYGGARAFLFPGIEDFGITPVESMASGRPVIAFGKGGVTETVVPLNPKSGAEPENPTGVFFDSQTEDGLVDAIKYYEKNENRFNPEKIRAHAQQFSLDNFKNKISAHIEKVLSGQ